MSVTKRDYLVSLGLAKADARGRFSKEAQAALDKAVSEGKVFADTPTTRKETVVITESYDVKKVRRWAARQGIALGQRGRIPASIVAQYLAENPAEAESVQTEEEAVAESYPAEPAAKEPVRDETVAYGFARRAEDAPEYLSEPVVAIENCGRCGGGIAYCRCTSGPHVPSYLTNGNDEIALLSKPE